jgi:hypothetical protein
MSTAPMKYAERTALGQHLKDEDHDLLVDSYRGFTTSGIFRDPYTFIIDFDGTDYYAINANQTVYGGPSDVGVDGGSAQLVIAL